MTVNSGFEFTQKFYEIFTPDVAQKMWGDKADEILAYLTDKDRELEDHLQQPEAIFSFAGVLTVSESGPWVARLGGKLTEVLVVIKTPGSSSTVVEVFRNGTSIGTVTVASGENIGIASFNTDFQNSKDYMHVGVTTAGTGAEDITVHGRFSK